MIGSKVENLEIRLLVFDLDGTLVDSKKDIALSANLALTNVGLPTFSENQIAKEIGQGSKNLFLKLLGNNTPVGQIEELILQFKQIYGENLTRHTKIYPGVLEALKHYSDLPKVIVTNKSQESAGRLVNNIGLSLYFDAVFGMEAFPNRKPDPGPLIEVCRRWGLHPAEAAMIGDSVFDMIAGKEAGLKTVGAFYGLGSAEDLKRHHPDFEIHSAHELIGLF